MEQGLFDRHKELLEHTTFWLFMFLFVFDYHFEVDNWASGISSTMLELLTYALVIYVNLWVLIPVLLAKGKTTLYMTGIVALEVLYIFIMRKTGLEDSFYEQGGWRNLFSMVLNTSLFILISTLYWYSKQWMAERERQLVLRSEKLEAELKFLRTQISPHFIFNTLNNIYSLALVGHKNAAPMVAKLAGILRYVLYEGSGELVFLEKELETMGHFVDLFMLRDPLSKNVDTYTEGSAHGWRVAPMLLVSLVENALKHSNIDQDAGAWIHVHTEITETGTLHFTVENAISQLQGEPQTHGGIGLQNLQRQLEINYPDAHQLQIEQDAQVFRVSLNLQLKRG